MSAKYIDGIADADSSVAGHGYADSGSVNESVSYADDSSVSQSKPDADRAADGNPGSIAGGRV